MQRQNFVRVLITKRPDLGFPAFQFYLTQLRRGQGQRSMLVSVTVCADMRFYQIRFRLKLVLECVQNLD